MELVGVLIIVGIPASFIGAAYCLIKAIGVLLDCLSPEESFDEDSEGDRDMTIHIEITVLPNPAERDKSQPQQPSISA